MAERAKIMLVRATTILLALLLNDGCPFTPASAVWPEQGRLEIRIKDHRVAIDDFSKLTIAIEKLMISPKPGLRIWRAGWHELTAAPDTIDLTRYVGGKGVRVYLGPIDAGEFDAFDLKIKMIEGVLKKNQRGVGVKDNLGAVKLSFEVAPQRETVLIIDLEVTDFSDHPPRGYELRLSGYELYTDGKLIAKVPPG